MTAPPPAGGSWGDEPTGPAAGPAVDRPPGRSEVAFLLLAGLFVAALVVCNLIANKFVSVGVFGMTFVLSAGALPYPATFLVTDLLSEVWGRARANLVVVSGFVASVFVLGVLWLGDLFPAIPESRVSDAAYREVFQSAWRVVAASMTAYLVAQLVDIRLFHFWRRLTNGRHLWLRNNGSTVLSQLLDSVLVVLVLFYDRMTFGQMAAIIGDLWLFKVLVALLDTPFFYLGTWALQRWTGRPPLPADA